MVKKLLRKVGKGLLKAAKFQAHVLATSGGGGKYGIRHYKNKYKNNIRGALREGSNAVKGKQIKF